MGPKMDLPIFAWTHSDTSDIVTENKFTPNVTFWPQTQMVFF